MTGDYSLQVSWKLDLTWKTLKILLYLKTCLHVWKCYTYLFFCVVGVRLHIDQSVMAVPSEISHMQKCISIVLVYWEALEARHGGSRQQGQKQQIQGKKIGKSKNFTISMRAVEAIALPAPMLSAPHFCCSIVYLKSACPTLCRLAYWMQTESWSLWILWQVSSLRRSQMRYNWYLRINLSIYSQVHLQNFRKTREIDLPFWTST